MVHVPFPPRPGVEYPRMTKAKTAAPAAVRQGATAHCAGRPVIFNSLCRKPTFAKLTLDIHGVNLA